jgi:hypothetical protein
MEESVRAFTRGSLRLEIARTELAWALARRRRGEPDAAAALHASAIARLREVGHDAAVAAAERRWEEERPS